MRSILFFCILILINVSCRESDDEIENRLFCSEDKFKLFDSLKEEGIPIDYINTLKIMTYFEDENYDMINDLYCSTNFSDSLYRYISAGFVSPAYALECFNDAIKRDKGNRSCLAYYGKARFFYNYISNFDSSKYYFNEALKLHPGSLYCLEGLMESYYQKGDILDTSGMKIVLNEIKNTNCEFLYYYAEALYYDFRFSILNLKYNSDVYSKLKTLLRKSLQCNKNYINSTIYLIYVLFDEAKSNKNDYGELIDFINQSIALNPTNSDLYVSWGDACLYMKDYSKADSLYGISIKLKPSEASYYIGRLNLKILLKQYIEAQRYIDYYKENFSNDDYNIESYQIILKIKQGYDVEKEIDSFLVKYRNNSECEDFLLKLFDLHEINKDEYFNDSFIK